MEQSAGNRPLYFFCKAEINRVMMHFCVLRICGILRDFTRDSFNIKIMNSFVYFVIETFQIHLKKPTLDAYWLAGFFEGDGCLSIAKTKKDPLVLSFILRQADPKVLYMVKDFLNCGAVYCDNRGYWTLSIRDKQGLLKVSKLLNGKLVLFKRLQQYKAWVCALNTKYGTNLVPLTTPAVLSMENAWLTGFADAEGSFNILLTKRKHNQKNRLRLRFYLDQAHSFESMKLLQNWLGGTLHSKTKNHKFYHRLMLDSFNKSADLVDYFTKFPPLTTCLKVRFIRYARVYRWYLLKEWQNRLKEIQHLIQLNKRLLKKQMS